MIRRRRFKFQLGFAALSVLCLFSWRRDDATSETAEKPMKVVEEVSVGSFAGRHPLVHETHDPRNCSPPSIEEFPGDLFNQRERRLGAVVIHFLVAFYTSWAIAIVCDDYFVPCLEIISDKTKLQSDVAGATFMAFGSSAPELFASIIGVFITEGDIGIGTILGSAVFNVLFVVGACGLGAGTVLYLAWWPFVRDNIFYLFSVVILILVLLDSIVTWPEALAMSCSYAIYLIIMYFNPRIEAWLYKITKTNSPEFKSDLHASNGIKANNNGYQKIVDEEQSHSEGTEKKTLGTNEQTNSAEETPEEKEDRKREGKQQEERKEDGGEEQPLKGDGLKHRPVPDLTLGTPFNPPEGLAARFCWFLGLPINIAYFFTIPDVKKESCQKWVAVSFIVCIAWIAALSYTLVWMVTIIGYTFKISDAVMGLTLVAFGSSVPDCSSSLFIARKGDGDMAVSNTVGSNTFDVLLCLGVPWLIKSAAWHAPIEISSRGLFVSCFFIVGSVAIAFFVLYLNSWVLNKKVGCFFIFIYFIFLGTSVSMEMFVFGRFRLPMCSIEV
ncbi:sodium/potassium/calcium exchanger 4-like [Acropora muricata]|uniref:sodium/potassium/calcium exchanger 4-like n=1 Tax=Acropora muricata TaxID=159855 RepID=UPI0034E52D3B